MKKLELLLTVCALKLICGEYSPWKSVTEFENQVAEYMSPRFPFHTEGTSFASESYPSDTCGVSASSPCENHARAHACMITANPAKATISFLRWGARYKEDGLPQIFTHTTTKCAPCAWWEDGCVPLMASSKRTRCNLEAQQIETVGGLTYDSECLNEWVANTLTEAEALRNKPIDEGGCFAEDFISFLSATVEGSFFDCVGRTGLRIGMAINCQKVMKMRCVEFLIRVDSEKKLTASIDKYEGLEHCADDFLQGIADTFPNVTEREIEIKNMPVGGGTSQRLKERACLPDTRQYQESPAPLAFRSNLLVGGLLPSCFSHNHSLDMVMRELVGLDNSACVVLNEVVPASATRDPIRDHLFYYFSVDADAREAYAITLPALPGASKLLIFRDTQCMVQHEIVSLQEEAATYFVNLDEGDSEHVPGVDDLTDLADYEQKIEEHIIKERTVRAPGLAIRVQLPDTYSFGCPSHHQNDMPDSQAVDLFHRTQLTKCSKCGSQQRSYSTEETCAIPRRVCENCPVNHWPDASGEKCVSCKLPSVAVYSEINAAWTCEACGLGNYIDTQQNPYKCTPLTRAHFEMRNGVVDYIPDHYHRIGFPTVQLPIPQYHYRNDSDFQAYPCSNLPGAAQSSLYRHLCGVLDDVYYRVGTGRWRRFAGDTDAEDLSKEVSVNSRGLMQLCTYCNPLTHYYVLGSCSGENGGFAGRCEPLTLKCAPDEGVSGCFRSWLRRTDADYPYPGKTSMRTGDNEVVPCRHIYKDVVSGITHWYRVVGCFRDALEILLWRDDIAWSRSEEFIGFLNNDDKQQILSSNAAKYYQYYHDVHSHINTVEAISMASRYSSSAAMLPFCPPGFYVNDDAGTLNEVTDSWSIQRCVRCITCIPPKQRTATWQQCSGTTTVDTESRCQEGCAVGFYNSETETEAGQCKPCQNCEYGAVV